MAKLDFSVVVPTYTGEDLLGSVLDSLLAQKSDFEVIVVIDGPKARLRKIAEEAKAKFKARGIKFTIHQFNHNQGRFTARLKGAELASSQRLVFCDDRIVLDEKYLGELKNLHQEVVIPNTVQVGSRSPVNRVLYLIRRKAYREWGKAFKSHEISAENFERSAKGTTSLMITKDLFIEICKEIQGSQKDLKEVSDDTKVLRGVIDRGKTIWRSSEAKIYYQPRGTITQQLKHLYDRGPKFVDYYLHPGTRFFYPLVLALAGFLALVAIIILRPWTLELVLVAVAVLDGLLALWLAERVGDFFLALLTLPVISIVSGVGMIKGLIGKLWR